MKKIGDKVFFYPLMDQDKLEYLLFDVCYAATIIDRVFIEGRLCWKLDMIHMGKNMIRGDHSIFLTKKEAVDDFLNTLLDQLIHSATVGLKEQSFYLNIYKKIFSENYSFNSD
jgi:hypothetical protein